MCWPNTAGMGTSIVLAWMQSMEKMSRWVDSHSIKPNSILTLAWFLLFSVGLLCWLWKHRIRHFRCTIRMGHHVQCHPIPSGPMQIVECSWYVRFSQPSRTRLHLQQLSGKAVQSARFVSANLRDSIRSMTKWERQTEINDFLHRYRDHLDKGLLVKMKNAQGRDVVDEINENLFPGCMV